MTWTFFQNLPRKELLQVPSWHQTTDKIIYYWQLPWILYNSDSLWTEIYYAKHLIITGSNMPCMNVSCNPLINYIFSLPQNSYKMWPPACRWSKNQKWDHQHHCYIQLTCQWFKLWMSMVRCCFLPLTYIFITGNRIFIGENGRIPKQGRMGLWQGCKANILWSVWQQQHKYAHTDRLRSIIFNTNNHSSKIWLSSNQRQELAAAAPMWP